MVNESVLKGSESKLRFPDLFVFEINDIVIINHSTTTFLSLSIVGEANK